MHILCLGANHQSTSLSLRERLVFPSEKIQAAFACLKNSPGLTQLSELVILSTCNRTELYAAAAGIYFDELETLLEKNTGVSADELRSSLFYLSDQDALTHLLRVTAGLDSLVLGEPQILGQTGNALGIAQRMEVAGALLTRLFTGAIHAGKRAHAETTISRSPTSISAWAASLCANILLDLPSTRVAVLGAGVMAQLAVAALRKRGAREIVVINRSQIRAQELAVQWNARAESIEQLENQLTQCDILIASTTAPHFLITQAMVSTAMQSRPERPLVLIDIAVPRNIDPAASELPGVSLYNIDDLNRRLEDSMAMRSAEIPRVEAILAEELTRLMSYLEISEVLPTISEMRQKAEAIRQAELDRTFRRLPDLSALERERIDAMTRALVKKLLNHPTQLLRTQTSASSENDITRIARSLFGLADVSAPTTPTEEIQ